MRPVTRRRSISHYVLAVWISVVIPALNEEEPIGEVVREVIATGTAREVVVVDNGSTDQTAERARHAGARVVLAPRGYGRACAAGVAAVSDECDVLVFLDGDGSDVPRFMPALVEPIINGTHDFVIGSRIPSVCSDARRIARNGDISVYRTP